MPEEDGIQIHLIPPEDSFIYQHKQHTQYGHSGTRPWAAHHVGSWRHKHQLLRMLNPITRRERSVLCSNCCLQETSTSCPVNTRLGGFHSTTKSLTWITEYSVGLLIVLKCNVWDVCSCMIEWLELLPHTDEVLGSNVEASYPDARYLWRSLVSPGKRLDSALI
jgi:hypothetical protein